MRGEFTKARSALERAWDLAAQQTDDGVLVRIDLGLAEADRQQGHKARAVRRADRAVRTLGRVGSEATLAEVHFCAGKLRLEAGDPASARWAFERALQLAERRPFSPSALATIYWYLGVTHDRLGNAEESRKTLHRAWEIAERVSDPSRLAGWYFEQAEAAAEVGNFDEALRQGDRALALYELVRYQGVLADIHKRLGEAEFSADRWQEARQHYHWSAAYLCATSNMRGAAQVIGSLIEQALRSHSPETAKALGEIALGILPSAGEGEEWAHILYTRGLLHQLLGRNEAARISLQESLSMFVGLGRTEEAKVVRRQLALVALEAQDLAEVRQQLTALCEADNFLR